MSVISNSSHARRREKSSTKKTALPNTVADDPEKCSTKRGEKSALPNKVTDYPAG